MQAKNTMVELACERCGVTFFVAAGRLKFRAGRFCSRACAWAPVPLAVRFEAKVERLPSGCWRWTGSLTKKGYGRFNGGGGRESKILPAHRVSFQLAGRTIPAGLQLDHLCRNRWCVNPDHLEAVTGKVNMERGMSPPMVIHRSGACKRGHPLTAENAAMRKDGTRAYCIPCRQQRRREEDARRKHERS